MDLEEILANVRLSARCDHPDDNTLPVQLIQVERIEIFSQPYPNDIRSPSGNDIGEIEVTYSRNGYRAIYGFTSSGETTLYAD